MTTRITPVSRDADGFVVMLDQRKLPFEETYVTLTTCPDVATAITDMIIRGAPAIGVAAAYGLALGARSLVGSPATALTGQAGPSRASLAHLDDHTAFLAAFDALATHMNAARPTAVNLAWAVSRMRAVAAIPDGPMARVAALDDEAQRIFDEDLRQNHQIGEHGAALIPASRADGSPCRVLTHCNAGSLATAGWGTALGVLRTAHAQGKRLAVFADETRPYLQGARLTAWELLAEGIDVTLLPDSAAGHLIARGEIDLAIVGADRIARNGDTANKIGTYTVAVLCARHGVPFYVAAPTTTLDLATADGAGIPIEERPANEVLDVFGHPIAPRGMKVRNPSFDVTPAALIAGIITERGVARAPYDVSLAALWAPRM